MNVFSRLTISTELFTTNNMKLIDVNGYPHDLTSFQVRMMIAFGWIAFILSWMFNILFYAVHPSVVDFNPERIRDKCYIYILGRKIHLLSKKGKKKISTVTAFEIVFQKSFRRKAWTICRRK